MILCPNAVTSFLIQTSVTNQNLYILSRCYVPNTINALYGSEISRTNFQASEQVNSKLLYIFRSPESLRSVKLLLWVGVLRRSSCGGHLLKNYWANLSQLVCSICRVRIQKIVNFMTPAQPNEWGGGYFGGKKCKIEVFL